MNKFYLFILLETIYVRDWPEIHDQFSKAILFCWRYSSVTVNQYRIIFRVQVEKWLPPSLEEKQCITTTHGKIASAPISYQH